MLLTARSSFMAHLAVFTMTNNAPSQDCINGRPIHPFFTLSRHHPSGIKRAPDNVSIQNCDASLPSDAATGSDKTNNNTEQCAQSVNGRGQRRKADRDAGNDETQKKAPPRKRTRHSAGSNITAHLVKLPKGSDSSGTREQDDGDDQALEDLAQKGQATNTLEKPTCSETSLAQQNGQAARDDTVVQIDPGQLDSSACDTNDKQTSRCHSTGDKTPELDLWKVPKVPNENMEKPKIPRLNTKTGMLGSPPKLKEIQAGEEDADAQRSIVLMHDRKPPIMIVRIPYGISPDSRVRIGEAINSILDGRKINPDFKSKQSASVNKDNAAEVSGPSSSKPAKAVHPFFLGRTKKPAPVQQQQDSDPSTSTSSFTNIQAQHYSSIPCSSKRSRPIPTIKHHMPQFGVNSMGIKFPGAKLPSWPWKGMMHIRGEEHETVRTIDITRLHAPRKSKGNIVRILPGESVVDIMTQSINIAAITKAVRNIDTDNFPPPPPELRLPNKHFESGSKLQARILPELKTFKACPVQSVQQSLPRMCNGLNVRPPPQLARLFHSISLELSAFDMSQCESRDWAQKYAPANAVEILQPGREAFLLRDWLQALMVQSVDTGSPDADKGKTGSKTKGTANKKKRKKKLDGFIVSSDEEDQDFYEPSDEDTDWTPSGHRGIVRPTVVKPLSNRNRGKTPNTLVISGPHGCGKTAVVYAVAKELGFEVFEINSSSRRSGKDVLEKIGDMTRNHHVQQHQVTSKPDDESPVPQDNVEEDIKSGKQSTMNAFFKPKLKGSVARQEKPSTQNVKFEPPKKEPTKNQRQSLILLEEVDILYEEDKQFWATVIGLIVQSKRPFVMTCNDETLVPLQSLRLYGIFRFSIPPRDLAVDRLLLIAANEGHALTRRAVEQLYDSRGCDLRAATMDLQYWCQVGVGDRRGGFDWFVPRWPKGVDLDENNEIIRVVSEGTYQYGMNLLCRDRIADSKLSPQLVEEELLHQTSESWTFDLGHWQDSVGLDDWAMDMASHMESARDRQHILEAYDTLAETMSTADICSDRSFAVFMEVGLYSLEFHTQCRPS